MKVCGECDRIGILRGCPGEYGRKDGDRMEEERDVVVFSDDEGNEFELEVVDYFDFEDQEYAVLMDPEVLDSEEEDVEAEVYIMKVVVDGEYEEFLPADEDKMEQLSAIVEQRFDEMDAECDCDCEDCEDESEDAECACTKHDHDHCGCFD